MRNGDRWFMGDFEQAEGNAIPARLREEGSRSFRKHLVTKRIVSNVLPQKYVAAKTADGHLLHFCCWSGCSLTAPSGAAWRLFDRGFGASTPG